MTPSTVDKRSGRGSKRGRTRMIAQHASMRSLQLVAAASAIIYLTTFVFVHRPAGEYSVVWDRWTYHVLFLLLIPPILLRARHSAKLGIGWLAIGLAGVLYEVGSVMYFIPDQHVRQVSLPVLSDLCYLGSLVAFVIGIGWLTQRAFGARMLSVRLDGAVVGFAVGSAAAAIRFRSIPQVPGGALQDAVSMSHPMLDLILLMLLVAGLSLHNYRPSLSIATLMLGVAVFVVGDVLYTREVAIHAYLGPPMLNGTWMLGLWLVGLAAWADADQRTSARVPGNTVPHGIPMLPIGSALVALSVVVMSLLSHVPRIALVLATCSLLLVIARMTVTLREARQNSLNFRDARTDELTGLSNRRGFLESITASLADRPRTRPLAVLLVDLNGFKEVNDTLGHLVGDELLTIVGRRFAGCLGREAAIARIGGDEFAMAFDVKCLDDAIAMARKLASTHSDQIMLDGVTVRVSASYGIALFPAHGMTPLQLLRSADVAMYEAKSSHRTICAYRAEHDRNSRGRLALVGELRDAIESDKLILHFQPTRDLRTQAIHGVEALVRWPHPTRGLLHPDAFIPMAERVGLLPSLSRVVIEKAITEAARLLQMDHRLQMSINISRFDLLDDTLMRFLEEALESVNLPGDLLTLEITESSIGEDPERSRQSIEQLRHLGIRVSIDDFGVGYSSMSQLLSLPLDEIKIDKSFILALRTDRRAHAIISSAIELARALDLTLVAEGIETAQSLRVLQELGADIGQGFYIAHPLTSAQLDDFLTLAWEGGVTSPAKLLSPLVTGEAAWTSSLPRLTTGPISTPDLGR
jgi:diguanylate cyclase (GGDEF)-like protein